jgi:hypothetical protein
MTRRRSPAPSHSTSANNLTRATPSIHEAKVLKLMASKRVPGEERVISGKDVAPGMPRSPMLRHLVADEGGSQHAARDRIVLERLPSTDTWALATPLLAGHIPGPTARQCLALMLLDWSEAKAAVAAKPAPSHELWQSSFRLTNRQVPAAEAPTPTRRAEWGGNTTGG